jgi:hypothetical protein
VRRIKVLLLIFIFLSRPAVLRAQSTNAAVAGRVTDPSKAVIADARVAAANTDTNVRYEGATNSSGDYYLTNLPPGSYGIEIEKAGFRKLIKPDVILHVQDALAIDFEMTLGSGSESITVQAGAPVVNTESATVSTVIDRTFAEGLPLNGRSFQTLILLTPGVVLTAAAYDDQGQLSVNGQRADANYFTVDGVSANFGVTGYSALVQAAEGGRYPRSAQQEGQTAWCRWMRCRSFAFKLHLSPRSLDAPPAAKSPSSPALARISFTAPLSIISAMTHSTPMTGSRTTITCRNLKNVRTVLGECSVALSSKTRRSSFSPTRGFDYANQLPKKRRFLAIAAVRPSAMHALHRAQLRSAGEEPLSLQTRRAGSRLAGCWQSPGSVLQ